jgi:hypothetical protein
MPLLSGTYELVERKCNRIRSSVAGDLTRSPVIPIYDERGTVIETNECSGDFKEWERAENFGFDR